MGFELYLDSILKCWALNQQRRWQSIELLAFAAVTLKDAKETLG